MQTKEKNFFIEQERAFSEEEIELIHHISELPMTQTWEHLFTAYLPHMAEEQEVIDLLYGIFSVRCLIISEGGSKRIASSLITLFGSDDYHIELRIDKRILDFVMRK
jgi:hypothetical protein